MFNISDKVMLKSGGPEMTVVARYVDYVENYSGIEEYACTCCWFNEDAVGMRNFLECTLVPYTDKSAAQ